MEKHDSGQMESINLVSREREREREALMLIVRLSEIHVSMSRRVRSFVHLEVKNWLTMLFSLDIQCGDQPL